MCYDLVTARKHCPCYGHCMQPQRAAAPKHLKFRALTSTERPRLTPLTALCSQTQPYTGALLLSII